MHRHHQQRRDDCHAFDAADKRLDVRFHPATTFPGPFERLEAAALSISIMDLSEVLDEETYAGVSASMFHLDENLEMHRIGLRNFVSSYLAEPRLPKRPRKSQVGPIGSISGGLAALIDLSIFLSYHFKRRDKLQSSSEEPATRPAVKPAGSDPGAMEFPALPAMQPAPPCGGYNVSGMPQSSHDGCLKVRYQSA